jgi:hypothetical protein
VAASRLSATLTSDTPAAGETLEQLGQVLQMISLFAERTMRGLTMSRRINVRRAVCGIRRSNRDLASRLQSRPP